MGIFPFISTKAQKSKPSRSHKVTILPNSTRPRVVKTTDQPNAEGNLPAIPLAIERNSSHPASPAPSFRRDHGTPRDRGDFTIILICALSLEAECVQGAFDKFWDDEGKTFGKANGDPNEYTTGVIGGHNVVLAYMPSMGTTSAAAVVAARTSYPNIKLAIVVGICGGAPYGLDQQEILLGDVVISRALVQYDLGRQHPGGFKRKTDIQSVLGRPSPEIRAIQARLDTNRHKQRMQQNLAGYLQDIQRKVPGTTYPGRENDVLYQSSYIHQHRQSQNCRNCGRVGSTCEVALRTNCDDLGCRLSMRETRMRLLNTLNTDPVIHLGIMGSGNTVMRSGQDRDVLTKAESIIAFEMEAAGVWEYFPCVVIKGVCDYADSHKHKGWQQYAAATAAACMKAFLVEWSVDRVPTGPDRPNAQWLVPFERNRDFVDRAGIMNKLLQIIPPGSDPESCQRTVIEGLGGTGKTQIALEAAFRIRDKHPDCSVFWLPAVDSNSFESAYREIGRKLLVPGLEENGVDVKSLVKNALNQDSCENWLLIIDNADDVGLLFDTHCLRDYLPSSPKGSILLTTRNHEAVVKLDVPRRNIIEAGELDQAEGLRLLRTNLKDSQMRDGESTRSLLELLTNLPIAIKQASAYMARTGMSTTTYLQHCQSSDETLIRLLSQETEYQGRYKGMNSAIASTWLMSFHHIQRDKPLAADILRGICFFVEKDIPFLLCPHGKDDLEFDEAIGVLKAYAFISEREDGLSFDIHRLVQLAMRNWLEKEKEQGHWIKHAIRQVLRRCPRLSYAKKDLWQRYLPHILSIIQFYENKVGEPVDMKILFRVAAFYGVIGNYREEESRFRQYLQGRDVFTDSRPDIIIQSMRYFGRNLLNQGKHEEALQILREAVDQGKVVLGEERRETILCTISFAKALNSSGESIESEKILSETLSRCETLFGKADDCTVKCMRVLGRVLNSLQRYEEAAKIDREIMNLTTSDSSNTESEKARSLSYLGKSLRCQGLLEEAENVFRQLTDRDERMVGESHPLTLADKVDLAEVCFAQKKYEESEHLYRQVLHLTIKRYGDSHEDSLEARSNLICVLQRQRKDQEANQLYSEMSADMRAKYDLLVKKTAT